MAKYKSRTGFTLIELLVVTAIIGVLAVVSATIFSSILKSQNKTTIINEARQNGNILIDKFERDVRQANNIPDNSTDTKKVTIVLDEGNVVWKCDDSITPKNITRDDVPLLNQDSISGIEQTSVCEFTVLRTANSQLVTFKFDLKQRNPFGTQFEILVPFEVSVGIRQ